jgi:hypothetical protein
LAEFRRSIRPLIDLTKWTRRKKNQILRLALEIDGICQTVYKSTHRWRLGLSLPRKWIQQAPPIFFRPPCSSHSLHTTRADKTGEEKRRSR